MGSTDVDEKSMTPALAGCVAVSVYGVIALPAVAVVSVLIEFAAHYRWLRRGAVVLALVFGLAALVIYALELLG